MESAPPNAPTQFVIAQGLRAMRRLRRRYWLVSGLGVPAVVVLGFVLSLLDVQARWVQTTLILTLVVGWLWVSSRLEQRLGAASCPRCGQPFFARQWGVFELHGVFFGPCRSCGLGLRADKHFDRAV